MSGRKRISVYFELENRT